MPRAAARLAALVVLLAGGAAAPGPAAAAAEPGAEPLAALRESCSARTSTDAEPVSYRLCSASLPSFDGTPLDATLTLPARTPRGRRRLPLVVFLHGLLADKREFLSETRGGTGPDRGPDAYKTVRWNNVWFASRGYAVLNYSARGHGDSGGQINLASKHVEVRDTHHLTGLLADERRLKIDPRRVAALGSSYGGGQTWLLVTTRGEGAPEFGSWLSPGGRVVRLAAAVPQYTWSDLLYTLVPNGRQRSDRIVDPLTANRPLGIGKQTLIDGFVASVREKLPPDALRWLARLNAGEPYDDPGDPVVPEARRALSEDRSAYFQDDYFRALRSGRQRRVPILAGQGWTDPIFAPIEALRMYRRLRHSSRGYPIQLYLGDFEHLTALVKIPDLRNLHILGNRMLDHFLRRRGRRPRFEARSAQTNCDPRRLGPVARARDWDALATGRLRLELDGPRTTFSPLSDVRGPATDPVTLSVQRGRGCVTTRSEPPAGAAAWELPVERAVTLLGLPRLRIRFRSGAPDLELNSRLWDVAPDGTQTLVSRGAYRSVAPDPAGEEIEYELFGNHWRFEQGHRILLEVVQDDSTFFRRDNFAGSAAIDEAELLMPVRE